jgi:hypothetical protein
MSTPERGSGGGTSLRLVVSIAVFVGLLTVMVGAIAINGSNESDSGTALAPNIVEAAAAPELTAGNAGAHPANTPESAAAVPTAPPGPNVYVQKPEYTNYTENITRVREHYAERHTYNTITVAWRPGAFPPERAAQVADMAARLLGDANARIGTNMYPELEIFLADQIYAPECHGCQGFAAADLFQIFILQDGSLAEDEFEALLIHEIVHVIAAHEISLPHSLFFAEGLATWVMSDYLEASGYLSPLQTAAWVYQVGAMPSLEALRKDDFAGRVRKRAEYDGAAAFAFFVIDTYGYEAYRELYRMNPPDMVIGKTWNELEVEWHAYLSNWAGTTVNGVDAHQWWAAMSRVTEGFGTLYTDPAPVTAEQYTQLVKARLAVNRGDVAASIEAINASGLVNRTAQ